MLNEISPVLKSSLVPYSITRADLSLLSVLLKNMERVGPLIGFLVLYSFSAFILQKMVVMCGLRGNSSFLHASQHILQSLL